MANKPDPNDFWDYPCECGHWQTAHEVGQKSYCRMTKCGCYTFRQEDEPPQGAKVPVFCPSCGYAAKARLTQRAKVSRWTWQKTKTYYHWDEAGSSGPYCQQMEIETERPWDGVPDLSIEQVERELDEKAEALERRGYSREGGVPDSAPDFEVIDYSPAIAEAVQAMAGRKPKPALEPELTGRARRTWEDEI